MDALCQMLHEIIRLTERITKQLTVIYLSSFRREESLDDKNTEIRPHKQSKVERMNAKKLIYFGKGAFSKSRMDNIIQGEDKKIVHTACLLLNLYRQAR